MRELLVTSEPSHHQFNCETKGFHFNKKISRLLTSSISFEFCPGRFVDYEELSRMCPKFISVTWLGDQLENIDEIPALDLSKQLISKGFNVLLHITGRNLDKEIALLILNKFKDIGIRNILVLQGDKLVSLIRKSDFEHASDLVQFIRQEFGDYFCIAVAGYPEKHPESKDLNHDLIFLQKKVSEGADFVITQASFNYESIESFAINCQKYGIKTPIIIGIFIINTYSSFQRITKLCNISVPESILKIVNANKNNGEALQEYGIHLATDLFKKVMLSKHEMLRGLHIFTLNNLSLVRKVFVRLRLVNDYIERPLLNW